MDILACLLMLPSYIQLEDWQIDTLTAEITFMLCSTQKVPCCPVCQTPTRRIHSHYERTIADLPWSEFTVCWKLTVRKCFCDNEDCQRRIFSERLLETVAPWARKTSRLIERLTAIGLALAGAAGERLNPHLNLVASRETLLRFVRQLCPPPLITPRVLGVDDFAFRKGHQYGTILVDLEQHQPIELLPDREAATLSQWLQEHPGVEIISRDRSLAYKQGASEGAPDAIQVADRFHLMENLAEALEKTFRNNVRELKEVESNMFRQSQLILNPTIEVAAVPPPAPEKKDLLHAQQCRDKRLAHYQQTWELHEQGLSFKEIAQQVGISLKSIQRYLKQPNFCERQKRHDRGRSNLDPYKPYILKRWNQGFRQGRQLYEEIKALGYQNSYNVIACYLRCLKQVQPPEQSQPVQCIESPHFPLTAQRATWLVLSHHEESDEDSKELLAYLKNYCSVFGEAITLTQDFTQMVREQKADDFDNWLKRATDSALPALATFAKGLVDDYDAVRAGLSLKWSNGPVEGLINRLKMLKRQMFGRAELDLLSRRFILTS